MSAAFSPTERIARMTAEPEEPGCVSDALDQDRRVAAFELSEESAFRVKGVAGPYAVAMGWRSADGGALTVTGTGADGETAERRSAGAEIAAAAAEYAALCEAYRDAVAHLPPARIEAIDAERKRAHDEAGALLADALAPTFEMDAATARRLFTLVCALGAAGRGA